MVEYSKFTPSAIAQENDVHNIFPLVPFLDYPTDKRLGNIIRKDEADECIVYLLNKIPKDGRKSGGKKSGGRRFG